ncbi:hypothetical protein PARPLA_02141 [Rhodobacteraceae bacterium THAF1]|uniref:hypothetical protein n=1 Tax=Palleronia sp. THAF1 TaxID=2587842 RepID=UPI000F4167A1|nr:hypothetical protein [Palleronia sp. THAF1]QFU07853.1 hypothetical protein FIU81_04110 [Palleronia sp. THAF1]VDC25687.1 hypothetical protein PARPLA_02141 [Rhodobacteraceae bacterium THAF1]
MIRNMVTLALLVFSIALALATLPVKAEGARCAPRDVVLAHLAKKYGESRRSIGLAGNGFVVETFASEGGSWTVVMTRPDGISCLVASGEHFETVDEPALTGDPA